MKNQVVVDLATTWVTNHLLFLTATAYKPNRESNEFVGYKLYHKLRRWANGFK